MAYFLPFLGKPLALPSTYFPLDRSVRDLKAPSFDYPTIVGRLRYFSERALHVIPIVDFRLVRAVSLQPFSKKWRISENFPFCPNILCISATPF
jgi:hypothetical protein